MSSLRRLEGESDPADMVAIVAITCPQCGRRGTMVLGFGPAATAEDADVLHELIDDRGDDKLPGDTAPREEATTGPPVTPPVDPIGVSSRAIMRDALEEFLRRPRRDEER
jgi:hypothetical protein